MCWGTEWKRQLHMSISTDYQFAQYFLWPDVDTSTLSRLRVRADWSYGQQFLQVLALLIHYGICQRSIGHAGRRFDSHIEILRYISPQHCTGQPGNNPKILIEQQPLSHVCCVLRPLGIQIFLRQDGFSSRQHFLCDLRFKAWWDWIHCFR